MELLKKAASLVSCVSHFVCDFNFILNLIDSSFNTSIPFLKMSFDNYITFDLERVESHAMPPFFVLSSAFKFIFPGSYIGSS